MTLLAGLDGRARVTRLLEAARRAVAPGAARTALVARLEQTTGLSRPNIEAALDECLELRPTEPELDALLASVPRAPRAHVILPANVFVAAHRALALALATSPGVSVKPSRREPALCEALHAQAPDLFEIRAELGVRAGDHVFAFGSDTSLASVRQALPEGAVLHAHGSGFGVAVVDLAGHAADADVVHTARAIARDTALFDQRGCLSPRFVLALGAPGAAQLVAERVAQGLAEIERVLPRGRLDASERAEARWWTEAVACFGRVFDAGSGAVAVRDPGAERFERESALALEVPPAGRHLEVIAIEHLEPALDALAPWLTSVGCGTDALARQLAPRLPRARVTRVGQMQCPAFDGPVDRRPGLLGEPIAASTPAMPR